MAERGFEDLDCCKLAIEVFREAYAVTKRLPGIERYNLADQLRRAVTSATLNIAEGYGRYHYLDKIRFYYIARGSLTEIQAAFVACQVADYVTEQDLGRQRDICQPALQTLNGLIRYTHRQRQGQKEYGDRALRETEMEYTTVSHFSDNPAPPLDAEFPNPGSPAPESPHNGG